MVTALSRSSRTLSTYTVNAERIARVGSRNARWMWRSEKRMRLHEGQRLFEVPEAWNHVLRHWVPKMWPQVCILIGSSGSGLESLGGSSKGTSWFVCKLTELQLSCRVGSKHGVSVPSDTVSRGRHVLSTLGGCDAGDSAIGLVIASGSRHMEQSSKSCSVVATSPRARNSCLEMNDS